MFHYGIPYTYYLDPLSKRSKVLTSKSSWFWRYGRWNIFLEFSHFLFKFFLEHKRDIISGKITTRRSESCWLLLAAGCYAAY